MKKLFGILMLIMILLPAPAHAGAIMEFERMDYDFGSVEQGRQLRYDFRFTNVGDEDLLIKTISPS